MIRFRLIEQTETAERWQVEHFPIGKLPLPIGIAWVSVRFGVRPTAQLIGILAGVQSDDFDTQNLLLTSCKMKWPYLKMMQG